MFSKIMKIGANISLIKLEKNLKMRLCLNNNQSKQANRRASSSISGLRDIFYKVNQKIGCPNSTKEKFRLIHDMKRVYNREKKHLETKRRIMGRFPSSTAKTSRDRIELDFLKDENM